MFPPSPPAGRLFRLRRAAHKAAASSDWDCYSYLARAAAWAGLSFFPISGKGLSVGARYNREPGARLFLRIGQLFAVGALPPTAYQR